MVTSCFFCQSLLSDYIEGILPSVRHEELKKHLDACKLCSEVHRDLNQTLQLLNTIPSKPLDQETVLRLSEASTAGKAPFLSRRTISQFALFASVPVLLFTAVVVTFPDFFPWLSLWEQSTQEESQLVKYFPLQQGASEVLEEQAAWLHAREPFMGSLWEEGGISPEEFEKTFQMKGSKLGEEK